MSEKTIMVAIQLAIPKMGHKLWRNNNGFLRDINGQYVHFGLCTGSSDLIGFTKKVITQDMVGKTIAIFTAIEVKTPTGVATKEQLSFLRMVNESGGIGFIARSVEEAIEKLKERI